LPFLHALAEDAIAQNFKSFASLNGFKDAWAKLFLIAPQSEYSAASLDCSEKLFLLSL
jgi:hypothetical protein